jgi:hypothetical protein
MNIPRLIVSIILLIIVPARPQSAQQRVKLGENAALRYWSAFAQMQDSAIADQQAKELNQILDGTAPYRDLEYKDLVEKNRPALETMARATALSDCDWGIDYQLGPEAPVDYVRKALALGRLNVLYAFHLLIIGNKDAAVRALAAGLGFSRDVADGGTLFATVVAKELLTAHIRAVESVLHVAGLSPTERSVLRKALAQVGPEGLDWGSAVKRELAILETFHRHDSQASAALARITPSYVTALNSPSVLPKLQQMIDGAPRPLRDTIPNPKRVLEEKQDLAGQLLQVRSLLQ